MMKSRRVGPALAIVVMFLLAGCMPLFMMAGCTSSNTIDGHRITATADIPQERSTVPDVYASAPEAARDVWRRYLKDADGNYAVLAVDRNARGSGYVYCVGNDCRFWEMAWASSQRFRYRHKALEYCRQNVRENYPAERPDCAIFAI